MKLTVIGFLKLKFNFWVYKSLKEMKYELSYTKSNEMLTLWMSVFLARMEKYLKSKYEASRK